jgi:hypothetical protein
MLWSVKENNYIQCITLRTCYSSRLVLKLDFLGGCLEVYTLPGTVAPVNAKERIVMVARD